MVNSSGSVNRAARKTHVERCSLAFFMINGKCPASVRQDYTDIPEAKESVLCKQVKRGY